MPDKTEHVVVTGSAAASIDLSELWRAHRDGPDGWASVTRHTGSFPDRVTKVAAEALTGAGADPAATGLVLGSLYGMGYVAESINHRLAVKGARWLDPDAFLHFTPHGLTATVCMGLGLEGFAATLLGPAAGLQAMAQAVRRIRLGRSRAVVCGAYEALSPAAAARVRDGSAAGVAAFLVLEPEFEARRRGARPLGTVRSVTAETEPHEPLAGPLPAEFDAAGGLTELAQALRRPDPARPEITVERRAPGLRYRCTLRKGAPDDLR
uniref:AtaPKS4 protein n=1 Tax=Saccharothrix mutabilis subsp. capreolus TaxID=66854 RepID=Q83W18_STRMP|nr:AtaPKS4 protein [Saccharothrix mutabilis subsp. capreolus]